MKKEGTGRTALVTGASAGIGAAFARVLAERGYAVALTARRQDRLDTLARELTATHGVPTHVITSDLANAESRDRLAGALRDRNLRIDFLVNNAGYGVPGRYTTTTWQQQRDFLEVLVVAVADLSHRLLPSMIEQKWGRIINVASLAGLLPGVAGHTLYAASKAFVIRFSESLALETQDLGVHVTASCPGFTHTEFHDVTGTRDQVNQLPSWMWVEATAVAESSYDAVMAGTSVHVTGRVHRSMARLAKILPNRLVTSLMTRNASKFRRV